LRGLVLDAKRSCLRVPSAARRESGCCFRSSKRVFEQGEKGSTSSDPKLRTEHAQRLASAGIDVESGGKERQFELRNWLTLICAMVTSIQDRMIASSGGP